MALPSLLLPVMLAVPQAPMAKRVPPPEVRPVVAKGVRYLAPNDVPERGYIVAEKASTGERLWEVTVYETRANPDMEQDVQMVFIRRMRIKGGALEVVDESKRVFLVDLKTREVKPQKR